MTFEYKLDSARTLAFQTSHAAFRPTGTSAVLIEGVKRLAPGGGKALDLGCGIGVVGIVLGSTGVIQAPVYASDLSADATALAKDNYASHGLSAVIRCGSLFEPWAGERFDLIIDDISGVAEPVAKVSPWFDNVPCNSGRDGTDLVRDVIAHAHDYLNDGGRLVFPVLSLSNRRRIIAAAQAAFTRVELLTRKDWPLPKEMAPHTGLLRELAAEGVIEVAEKFGMVLWSTEVYVAFNG